MQPIGRRTKDRTGEVHGYLTVVEIAGYRYSASGKIQCALWKAKCKCGKVCTVEGPALGKRQFSCGRCWSGGKNRQRIQELSDAFRKTLIGLSKGRLTILSAYSKKGLINGEPANRLMCRCYCECGSIKDIPWSKIQQREFPSCRCRNNELTSERCRRRGEENLTRLIDQWVSEKVGRLTITKIFRDPGKPPVWAEASCECGGRWDGPLRNLISHKGRKTVSCGCYLIEKLKQRHLNYRLSKGFREDQLMSAFATAIQNACQPLFRVTKRRDGCCIECGKTKNLRTHHIVPRNIDIDLHLYAEPSNLITLCRDCHVEKAHRGNVRGPVDPVLANKYSDLARKREQAVCSKSLVEHESILSTIQRIKNIFMNINQMDELG